MTELFTNFFYILLHGLLEINLEVWRVIYFISEPARGRFTSLPAKSQKNLTFKFLICFWNFYFTFKSCSRWYYIRYHILKWLWFIDLIFTVCKKCVLWPLYVLNHKLENLLGISANSIPKGQALVRLIWARNLVQKCLTGKHIIYNLWMRILVWDLVWKCLEN